MKKIFLVFAIIVLALGFTGCGKKEITPESQAKLTKTSEGIKVEAVGTHPVEVTVTLIVNGVDTAYPGIFEAKKSCTLSPGESEVLRYNNSMCKTLDFKDTKIKVLPKPYDMKGFVVPTFIATFIALLILFCIIPNSGQAAGITLLISVVFAFFALAVITGILGIVNPGPSEFLIDGVKFSFEAYLSALIPS